MARSRVNSVPYGVCASVVLFAIFYFHKSAYAPPPVPDLRAVGKSPGSVLRRLQWTDDGLYGNASDPDNDGDDDTECREVLKQNKSFRCDFVKATDDCHIDEGFIDYTHFVYCSFATGTQWLGMVIMFIWWLFLFVGLAVTADDFFCPALEVIAKTMRLSHNIAGVTFLAFGNGAPDIFSAIAAIGNAKNGDAGLAIGALFGAGVFVTTIVAGTISIICPFEAMQRPFLRDIIFYLGAVFWSFTLMWKKEIKKMEAIGFILLYVGYVIVVIVGRYIYQKQKRPQVLGEITVTQNDDDGITREESEETSPLLKNEIQRSMEDSADQDEAESEVKKFFKAINPIDTEGWYEMKLYRKIYEIFKSPIVFLLVITVPVVNYDEKNHNWNRYLNSLQCLTGLVFSSLATKVGLHTIGSSFPLWALAIIIGAVLGILVFCTSKNNTQPVYHPVFAYLGFLVAVIWIYSVANEIVNILQTFGIVLNISNAVLGLTLLAWGNSIGDLIADTVMARQGYPRMGISACFGGPFFNLVLGIGIPFTIATIKNDKSFELQVTLEELVLAGFLALSLITSLLIVPLSKFFMSRGYGITLVVLYVVFLVVALLTESNVIKSSKWDSNAS